jgi:hypothetical protein
MFRRYVGFIILVAALVVAATPSFASANGLRKGRNSSTASGPALTGVVSAASYTVTGSGFTPGETVVLNIGEANGCCNALNIVADSSGGFSHSRALVGPGTYTVKAAELIRGQWQFVAQWSFDAY